MASFYSCANQQTYENSISKGCKGKKIGRHLSARKLIGKVPAWQVFPSIERMKSCHQHLSTMFFDENEGGASLAPLPVINQMYLGCTQRAP